MSLSNLGSATATNSSLNQKNATNSLQNKANFLPNPFDLHDPQILDRVYLTHVTDDEFCDTNIIFELVSSVVLQVIRIHFFFKDTLILF